LGIVEFLVKEGFGAFFKGKFLEGGFWEFLNVMVKKPGTLWKMEYPRTLPDGD